MDTTVALFFVFALVLLYAAFRVITAKSPVVAALHLVLAFFNASCVWMLLNAEFLAISLVLVYVGAVMVLFLFVVMMLDINTDTLRAGFWKHFPLAGVVGAVIALEMALVLTRGFRISEATPMAADVLKHGNTKALGIELYSHYLFPVQIAALILLVAIIAAIALTLRRRKDSRSQSASEQVKARKADRLKIVKVAPVLPQPPAPPAEGEAAAQPKGQA
ncbi:MAG: NADH-quinone oxidoreductase subunit J [Aquabacterium sp.]|jgi:NADH-quinone oxidoreductase subunit J|nr:MAG: NADH-quinone oxidoreductase subunit J [Aquabacterium sp.]